VLAAFDGMQAGRAQWVCVAGEAGSGKTRLLDEVLARLAADGRLQSTAVRRAACASLGEPTYGIFGTLFRDAYRVEATDTLVQARHKLHEGLAALGVGADEAEAIAQVLDVLVGLPGSAPRDIEPEQLQRQIVLAARALFAWRVAQRPLLIVVEDLQWGDAASVHLLRDAVDHLADRPFMVLVTHRPDPRAWQPARAQALRLDLAPLDAAHTGALVAQLLGGPASEVLDQLQAFVVARAGGNPLFVEEIVRSLVGRGLLVRGPGGWVCTAESDAVDVPATLVGLLLSRIDRLAAETRQVLQCGAVLGAAFDLPLLERLVGDAPATRGALAELLDADLWRREPGGGERLAFTHALVHEVAYQNLLLARRTALHERAGRTLEAVVGCPGEGGDALCRPSRLAELEALAHHWSLSPDKRRGARYLIAAGDWARAVYANDDAIRHYERALRTLAACADACATDLDALSVREHLGDVLALCGRRAQAQACFETVQQAMEPLRDPSWAARLDRKLGELHWEAGVREQASAAFARGLQRLGEGGDRVERAHLFEAMGRWAFRGGDHAAAVAWAGRALAEVDEVAGDSVSVLVQARNTLGVALARTGRLTDAVREIERSIALAEANALLPSACRGYTNLAVLYATLDPQRSIATCLRGLEMAKKVGDLGFQSRLYANLAVAYCALTDRCEAEGLEAAQAAASLDRRLGLLDHLAVPLIVLGQIHQCHGDAGRAFASYREALVLAEQADEPQLLFPCYDGLATLYLDAGDMARAEGWLAKAQAVCQRAGLDPDALMVLPFLC
jgi:adenylate cyclase